MSEQRENGFYVELVLVTIFSLIAANAWIKLLYDWLDQYHSSNLGMTLIASIVLTVVSIVALRGLFTKNKDDSSELTPNQKRTVNNIFFKGLR